MAQTNIAAIILAAGRGERAGTPGNGPKQYRKIGGETVISRTISAFRNHPSVGQVIVVIHRDDGDLFDRAAGAGGDNIRVVEGGATRQASTLAGLRAFSRNNPPEYVLIHDAARPFVSDSLLSRIAGTLAPGTGVLPALPVSDTIKRSTGDGMVSETVLRDGLFAAQTPQAFPFEAILAAHESSAAAGHDDFTDDAAIAEWAGIPVKIIAGDAENIKLTWAKDIEMADMQLSSPNVAYPDVRTGSGYDVHAFGEGDHVVLCGVEIPFGRGLSGHSDADAGLHALTDALLATCGAGDIGSHFPPSDPQWKGAGSHIFLRHAADIVRGAGGRIANADITIICEAPRIGPHHDAMVSAMAGILQIEPARVSVKATTNEKLGFVGREEGIAAIASVSVVFPGEVPQ